MKKDLTKKLSAVALAWDLPKLDFIENKTFVGVIADIVSWFFWIAGALALIFLVYSGIMYITSAGNPEKATAAKGSIIYAIIGIAIVFLSLAIIEWVRAILS